MIDFKSTQDRFIKKTNYKKNLSRKPITKGTARALHNNKWEKKRMLTVMRWKSFDVMMAWIGDEWGDWGIKKIKSNEEIWQFKFELFNFIWSDFTSI